MADGMELVFTGEPAVLRRFLGLLMEPVPVPPWNEIDQTTRAALQSTFLLLDTGSDDTQTFVTYALERLMRQLDHTTERLQTELQGRVRGRVVWPATVKVRHGRDYDPTRYVCREARHDYDTPENQLLKYIVERVHESLQLVPGVLRSGACYFPASGNKIPIATSVRLGAMEVALRNFRRHARMRDVVLPRTITERHLLHAETSRMEEYAMAARVYRRYQSLTASPTWWKEVAAISKRVLPLPGRVLPDGDAWIALGVAAFRL
jgi:hypothetical protein